LEGGAEVKLTMLFADVRGSTSLAETKGISDFTSLIQRFYKVSTQIILNNFGMVNRLMGDQVIGLFVPRFSGEKHAQAAIVAANKLLGATGHLDSNGPWASVGIGIHSGPAYVGTVGSGESVNEIAVLGTDANLTARLSSEAAQGEILISQEGYNRAELTGEGMERREFKLKGINNPVAAWEMRISATSKIDQ
jgi:adenylate cyclase